MTVSFRNLTTGGDTAATSVVCSAPSGLTNGDILLYFVYHENTNAVTFPAGFSTPYSVTYSTTFRLDVAWKRAAGESGSYTASWTGSVFNDAILLAYSGCLAAGDPTADVTPTTHTAASESKQSTFSAITTVTNNDMVLALCAYNQSQGNNWSKATGWDSLRGNFDDIATQELLKATAGTVASGSMTLSLGSNGPTAAITLTLKPDTGGNLVIAATAGGALTTATLSGAGALADAALTAGGAITTATLLGKGILADATLSGGGSITAAALTGAGYLACATLAATGGLTTATLTGSGTLACSTLSANGAITTATLAGVASGSIAANLSADGTLTTVTLAGTGLLALGLSATGVLTAVLTTLSANSADRTLAVSEQDRLFAIAAQGRALYVAGQDRTLAVAVQDRAFAVQAQDRIYKR